MNGYIKTFLLENLINPTIIEAGTASGYDTQQFCEMFPDGKIYGFEPIPELFQQATERIKNYKNVIIKNNALSTKNGTSEMYVADAGGEIVESSSVLKPKVHLTYHPHITFNKKIVTETIMLDSFIEAEGINTVDLLWLDLQGFEPLVLDHSPKVMASTKYIFTEINLMEVYENVMVWTEFEPYMLSKGFRKIWDDITPNVDAANALFEKF